MSSDGSEIMSHVGSLGIFSLDAWHKLSHPTSFVRGREKRGTDQKRKICPAYMEQSTHKVGGLEGSTESYCNIRYHSVT